MSEREPTQFVISLDGGGVRCFLQLGVLERLLEVFPQLLERVTLFAGTSAGSFVALGLALGDFPLCKRLFDAENVQRIFSRSWGECISGGWGTWRPKYDGIGLSAVLREAFGEATLGSLGRRVLVTTFDLEGKLNAEDPRHHNFGVQHWSPHFYDNFPDSPDLGAQLHDVALESSAAPYYFPSHGPFVDGGVVANNPSAHAVARLLREGHSREAITLLSIGGGNTPFHIEPAQSERWGFAQWAPVLLNLVMDAPSEAAVMLTQDLLGERYHRCNPILPQEIELDNAAAIGQLGQLAKQVDLLPTLDFLYRYWFPELPRMLPAQIELLVPSGVEPTPQEPAEAV